MIGLSESRQCLEMASTITNANATDTHLPTKAPQTDGLSRDEVRGRSAGIILGAVMGLTWVGGRVSISPPPPARSGAGNVDGLLGTWRIARRRAAGVARMAQLDYAPISRLTV